MNKIRIFDTTQKPGQRQVFEAWAHKTDEAQLQTTYPEGSRFLWLR